MGRMEGACHIDLARVEAARHTDLAQMVVHTGWEAAHRSFAVPDHSWWEELRFLRAESRGPSAQSLNQACYMEQEPRSLGKPAPPLATVFHNFDKPFVLPSFLPTTVLCTKATSGNTTYVYDRITWF